MVVLSLEATPNKRDVIFSHLLCKQGVAGSIPATSTILNHIARIRSLVPSTVAGIVAAGCWSCLTLRSEIKNLKSLLCPPLPQRLCGIPLTPPESSLLP